MWKERNERGKEGNGDLGDILRTDNQDSSGPLI